MALGPQIPAPTQSMCTHKAHTEISENGLNQKSTYFWAGNALLFVPVAHKPAEICTRHFLRRFYMVIPKN